MEKFSGKMNALKTTSEDKIEKWSEELQFVIRNSLMNEADGVQDYVDQLRKLNPGISNEEMVKKIINRRALKCGGIGAITGMGGILTMPITMPVDMYHTFKIQAVLVMAIAYIYGWNIRSEDMITDILLVMGGSSGLNALKNGGIKIGEEFGKKFIDKFITREVMKKVNKIISRKIITKAGEKSLTSFTKLVPLAGAPIGGGINYFGTMAIGKAAWVFYKG